MHSSATMFTVFISIAIGAVGLFYAFYQIRERRKLARFIRMQAWYIYAKANCTSGAIQTAFRAYKEIHKEEIEPILVELLAKSDAFSQELYRETIRQIQLCEPQFDSDSIQEWINQRKVDPDHRILFDGLVTESEAQDRMSFLKYVLSRQPKPAPAKRSNWEAEE